MQTVTSLKDIHYVLDPVLIGQTIPSANEIIYFPNPIETWGKVKPKDVIEKYMK